MARDNRGKENKGGLTSLGGFPSCVSRRPFSAHLDSPSRNARRSRGALEHDFGRDLAARMADLLGRAERSSLEAPERRAVGAGLDGGSAHRAIMILMRC